MTSHREREFLNWFYQGPAVVKHEAIPPESLHEYLRTFSGTEGVMRAIGVYRAAFTTIEQTAPLTRNKVRIPVVAIGGEKGLGGKVGEAVFMVASQVKSVVLSVAITSFPKRRQIPLSINCAS